MSVTLNSNVVLSVEGVEQWRGTLGEFIEQNSADLTLAECSRIGDDLRAVGRTTLDMGAGGVWVLALARLGVDAVVHLLAWYCEQLVRGLLRPVWGYYVAARDRGDVRLADRRFSAFTRLVDAAPCWPCCVEYGPDIPLQIYVPTADDIGGDWL